MGDCLNETELGDAVPPALLWVADATDATDATTVGNQFELLNETTHTMSPLEMFEKDCLNH